MRILIADDHALFRDSLRSLLEARGLNPDALHENVATAPDVDRIFTRCFEHRMGPLETADLIGLDTVLQSIEVLHEAFADSKYRPCPLLRRMVDAGLLGRKSGQGFYQYRAGEEAR